MVQQESNGDHEYLVKVFPKPVGMENCIKTALASETVGTGLERALKSVGTGNDRMRSWTSMRPGITLREMRGYVRG